MQDNSFCMAEVASFLWSPLGFCTSSICISFSIWYYSWYWLMGFTWISKYCRLWTIFPVPAFLETGFSLPPSCTTHISLVKKPNPRFPCHLTTWVSIWAAGLVIKANNQCFVDPKLRSILRSVTHALGTVEAEGLRPGETASLEMGCLVSAQTQRVAPERSESHKLSKERVGHCSPAWQTEDGSWDNLYPQAGKTPFGGHAAL